MKENKENAPLPDEEVTAEAQTEVPQNTAEASDEPQKQKDGEADALKSELQTVKAELDSVREQLVRMAAEYDNFKKRTKREKDELFDSSKVFVVKQFLPVIDNFERAGENETTDFEEYKKGMDMIIAQFGDAVKALGVEAFGQVGDGFDPMLHNAVMHIEDESLGENVISKVFQKGYKLNDTVLRHAMVETAN